MPRNVDSYIIRRFIDHCESGLISAEENTSGEGALESVVNAFRGILEGYPPDDVLQIDVLSRGHPTHPHTVRVAWAAYRARLSDDPLIEQLTWPVITRKAALYLHSVGMPAKLESDSAANWDSAEKDLKRSVKRLSESIESWLHYARGVQHMFISQRLSDERNGASATLFDAEQAFREFDDENPDSLLLGKYLEAASELLLFER